MRILIVSTHDNRGGAAKAAYRFTKEFKKQGNEVCMYVRDKTLDDDFIKESKGNKKVGKLKHLLDFLPGYILSGFNKGVPFTLGLYGESLDSIIREFKPDIVNVHWTWKGFISFPQICKISKKIPVVYTMHDYSPFSGGTYYPNGEGPLVRGLAKMNSFLRSIHLKNSNITFVSPSEFLLEEFKKSKISKDFKGVVVNNGVDTNIFKRYDRQTVCKALGLKGNKKYVLFGAINLMDNPVKGGPILLEVLREMEGYFIDNSIGLISFGSQNLFEQIKLDERIETKFLGFIKTDKEMAEVLSSADLMLVPSLRENYPFVVLEPLACGTPVIAFKVGGVPEMIEDRKNGYLVNINDKKGFISCISQALGMDWNFPERVFRNDIGDKSSDYLGVFNKLIKI